MSQAVHYIDAAVVIQRLAHADPDAWIVPTYRRWIGLGLAVTAALMGWAILGGWT